MKLEILSNLALIFGTIISVAFCYCFQRFKIQIENISWLLRNTNSYGLNPGVVETNVFIVKQQEVINRSHSLPLSLRCLVMRLLMACMYLLF